MSAPAPVAAPAVEPALELEDVTRRFGATLAVDRLSLRVEAGSCFGLIGPNGAGKTTTFSMICGYLRPTSGRVRVLGHTPGRVAALKGRLAALPQDAALPANDPVSEVLAYYARLLGMPGPEARRAAAEGLERVGLSQWGQVRCGALSHGMAKRVGVAQAFLGAPELVLLDEPTAGLDPKSAFQLRAYLKEQRRAGHTIVISSHNLHELEELCDAAAVLDHGRRVTAGTMAELTRAVGEVRFLLLEMPPLEELQALEGVKAAHWDPARRLLTVAYAPGLVEAEDMIGRCLQLLLARGARIGGVSKGHSLEERVLELT